MDKNQIHQLLAKYFEGNTTLDEERVLLDFFSALQDEEAELRPLKKQFDLFRTGREFSLDATNLESKILEGIKEYEMQIRPAAKKRNITRYLLAASIIGIIAISGIVFFKAGNNRLKDTYSDPQLAYAETQKALLFVSQKMNQGMKPLANITKITSGSGQLKNLEKMDKSLGMLNLVSFINQSSNLKK
jgi:hypothetical protein